MFSLGGFQSCRGSLGSAFSWLWITARCGVCFRRIMFPILTTVQPWRPFITALNVNLMFEHPPIYICGACAQFSNADKHPADSEVWKNILRHLNFQNNCAHVGDFTWMTVWTEAGLCRDIYELTHAALWFFYFLQDLLQEVRQLKNKVEELEGEKCQYERKLRATKVQIMLHKT